jgi:hypothetical protein
MSSLRRLACAVQCALMLTFVGAPAAFAETLYVIEHLVVGVTSEPDGESERITTIRSGDRVEVLERQGDYARVQLSSGTEGWVRSNYLSPELPLQQRLNARTQEAEQLKKTVRKLETELAEARTAASAAVASTPSAPAQAPAPVAAQPESVDAVPPESPALLMPQRTSRGPGWAWVLGSSAVCLLVGFGLGWRVLDRRIRAKYGGLRIY